jgi:8-oxo-dGTP diphosphatase
MRARLFSAVRPTARRATLAIDVVPLTPMVDELAVLLVRAMDPRARERWMLPWDAPRDVETLDDGALRITRAALGEGTLRLERLGAFGDGRRHPGDAEVSVAFAALIPFGNVMDAGIDAEWHPTSRLPAISPRHEAIIAASVVTLRDRIDVAPIAFELLQPSFTLSELQSVYELLLGRRLHKASFRRTLQATAVVEPTGESRSEGRGRPAQLFRYAGRENRGGRRSVRFELL